MAIEDVQNAFVDSVMNEGEGQEKDDDLLLNEGTEGEGEGEGEETEGEGEGEGTEGEGTEGEGTEGEVTWGKALGVDDSLLDVDEEGNLKGIITNVNGQNEVVDLPSLIAGFQNNRNNTIKSQAIAAEKQQFETIREQAAKEYVDRLTVVDTLAQHLHNKLLGDAKSIDWDKLRVENPGEYAAKVQDITLRQQEISELLQTAAMEKERVQKEAMDTQNERMKAFRNEQAQILIQRNPEWKQDQGKMTAAFAEMSQFATETYGFSMDEFNSVADARLLSLLQDAIKYRKNASALPAKKIPAQIPKFQKSSGKKGDVSKLKVLTNIAKKSTGASKRTAQTNAIAELLLNGD